MIPPRKPVRRFTGLAGSPLNENTPAAIVTIPEDCQRHGQPKPCYVCARFERERIIRDAIQRRWIEIDDGIHSTVKCVHGHMYSERYCDVCRLGPVDPGYNPNEYADPINKALAGAIGKLKVGGGLDDWKDLRQLVDLEIWQARKKYGEEWNGALAYTVARNVAGAFLGERIREQYIMVEDADGNPVLDESGTQKRIPRFAFIDLKLPSENGGQYSPVELQIARKEMNGDSGGDTDWSGMVNLLPELRRLAATWHGVKRKVAEAMLTPGFSVRGVPGVPKSTVARVRQTVIQEFRKTAQTTDNTVDVK